MRIFILPLTAGMALSTIIAVDRAYADTRRDRSRVGRSTPTEEPRNTNRRGGRHLPSSHVTEAPTGFDNLPNGHLEQGVGTTAR